MSAELAARRTAAAAVLADYTRAAAAAADVADRALWAARLAGMLGLVLAQLEAEAVRECNACPAPASCSEFGRCALEGNRGAAPVPAAAVQLEEVRLVIGSSRWQDKPADIYALIHTAEHWQCALEQINGIVKGGGR